jgi:hypothetical protein
MYVYVYVMYVCVCVLEKRQDYDRKEIVGEQIYI